VDESGARGRGARSAAIDDVGFGSADDQRSEHEAHSGDEAITVESII
jgi:hypothetical protein